MRTCNLRHTLDKNDLESKICNIEKEIMTLQSMNVDELSDYYHNSNHFLKEIKSDVVNELVDLKNSNCTIDLLDEAITKTNFLIETSENIRAMNNELLTVYNNQILNKDMAQTKIKYVNLPINDEPENIKKNSLLFK